MRKGWRDDEGRWGRMVESELVFLWNCLCLVDEWLYGGGSFSPPPCCADKWAFLRKTGKVEDLPIPTPPDWCFSSAWSLKELSLNCGCRPQRTNHIVFLNPGSRERASFWYGIISNKYKEWDWRLSIRNNFVLSDWNLNEDLLNLRRRETTLCLGLICKFWKASCLCICACIRVERWQEMRPDLNWGCCNYTVVVLNL